MTVRGPGLSQIMAKVAAIRQKKPRERIFGIHSESRWTGESTVEDSGEVWRIEQCDSPLHIREVLSESNPDETTVIVTGIETNELDDDICLRLARRSLQRLDSWETVRALFHARAVDPQIARKKWVADKLLQTRPDQGYRPVTNGFLDADTVWQLLVKRDFGMDFERPDLLAVLTWSIEENNVGRFRQAEDEYQQGVVDWLVGTVGPAVDPVLQCILKGQTPQPIPVGLAAGVVYHNQPGTKLAVSAGRFETYLAGRPESGLLARWIKAADEAVRIHVADKTVRDTLLHTADKLLVDVAADAFAWLSPTSPAGLMQRLRQFAERLTAAVGSQNPASHLSGLKESSIQISEHALARDDTERQERVAMALRLVRWLGTDRDMPASFEEAAVQQVTDSGFVDWARLSLRGNEPVRELADAYARLCDQVRDVREQQSQVFAELLRDWTQLGSRSSSQAIPVEDVLDRIVTPVAVSSQVLLILLDGMSAGVFQELMQDITRQDWLSMVPHGAELTGPAIATLPSITNISRTSLFCSRLRKGGASDERIAFKTHEGLNATSTKPPILFHKGDLRASDQEPITSELRSAIESRTQQVVGVVVNAVDDYLAKSEQLQIQWTRDAIRILPTLLHEAQQSGRVVILLSDHGHVIDHDTRALTGEGGARWRAGNKPNDDGEIAISGDRVITDDHSIVVPWSEQIRYTQKQNGYHGGANPQEMVIPIAVLSSRDTITDWDERPFNTPDWWDAQVTTAAAGPTTAAKLQSKAKTPTGVLFDKNAEPDEPTATDSDEDIWFKTIDKSELFAQQRRIAGRGVPSNREIAQVITVLDGRGGKMTIAGLARNIETPVFRMNGMLAVLQRVLNVDGYPVLSRDEPSASVELNRELLCTQFGLLE